MNTPRRVVLIDGPFSGVEVQYDGGAELHIPAPSDWRRTGWQFGNSKMPLVKTNVMHMHCDEQKEHSFVVIRYRMCRVQGPGEVYVGVCEGW